MIETGWVKGPKQITGLDHLGVQAPCINIYAQLLPGITNVTDRARYYSFYPWLLTALDNAGYSYGEEFIKLFRRADVLLTLISLRHQEVCADGNHHSDAAVGTIILKRALHDIHDKGAISISKYSSTDAGEDRYFKNKLGGLGQYYLGVLRGLGLMDGSAKAGVSTFLEVGGVIASKFASGLPTEKFIKTVQEDSVDLDRLDELSGFCLCKLKENADEKNSLIELFSGSGKFQSKVEFSDNDSERRRKSLSYFLSLSKISDDYNYVLDIDTFRALIYCRSFSSQQPVSIPSSLDLVSDGWASYQRNELLSVALQGLFFACLRDYELSGESFDSVELLAHWFWNEGVGARFLNIYKAKDYGLLQAKLLKKMPKFKDWQEEGHEIQSMFQLKVLSRESSISNEEILEIVESSLRILAALGGRKENKDGYGDLYFPKGYFEFYPVNLNSFSHYLDLDSGSWTQLKVEDCLKKVLADWCLSGHLRVALRKLRLQSQNTFRFMPTDLGIRVVSVPKVANTQPRFRQAQAILKDVGLLVEDPELGLIVSDGAIDLLNPVVGAA